MRMRAPSGGSLKNCRAAAITAGSISTTVCAARGRCLWRKRVSEAAPSPISSTLRGQPAPPRNSSGIIMSRV